MEKMRFMLIFSLRSCRRKEPRYRLSDLNQEREGSVEKGLGKPWSFFRSTTRCTGSLPRISVAMVSSIVETLEDGRKMLRTMVRVQTKGKVLLSRVTSALVMIEVCWRSAGKCREPASVRGNVTGVVCDSE